MRRSDPAAPTLTTPAEEFEPAYVPNVVLPIVVLLTTPVPPVAVVAVPDVTAPEPSATEPATLAVALGPSASELLADTVEPVPIATPDVAALCTTELRPTAIDVVASAAEPPVPELLPPPIAIALLPDAVASLPSAVAPMFSAFAPEPMPIALAPLAVVA
ncbi:hypothetical protein WT11_30115 [Burkholderia stagnalis]|nr:hypothetical protein WT11_30115 [Burkholderia stagnalis]